MSRLHPRWPTCRSRPAADGGSRGGFSLIEATIATAIVVIAATLAVGGLIYLLRTHAQASIQSELDIDVQKAMERVKRDLRLSSLDKMFYYPAGTAPYTAISFPMAEDNDGDGAVETDANGRIIWDRTVVYHVWASEPTQLRKTVFAPRDNSLTDAQRQQQIDSVVVKGNGSAAPNGAKATTTVVFENLFQWDITPQGAVFDGYAPAVSRAENVSLGSCIVSNGVQAFTFRVTGKNPLASGYRIGLDTLFGSPCYAVREAEALLPPSQAGGAAPVAMEMTGGSWSGNHQLSFPATAPGDYLVLNFANDGWVETNFRATGAQFDKTTAEYDTGLSPRDFVLQLEGMTNAWFAYEQTGDTNATTTVTNAMKGTAVRVLLRGSDMTEGNWIRHSGARCKVAFAAGYGLGADLVVDGAWIGQCASNTVPSMDVAAGTQRALTFGGSPTRAVPQGTEVWTDFVDLPIERTNSYLVSFFVSKSSGHDLCRVWRDGLAPASPSSYVIPAASVPGPADAAATTWSARADVVATNLLYGVSSVFVTHPARGVYTSRILHTQQAAPRYAMLGWNALVPSGGAVALKVRSGAQPDLSDAVKWSNASSTTAGGSLSSLPQCPYVQFQAELTSPAGGTATPRVRDVTLTWDGITRIVDVGGTFTRGPDHGIFELLVNGKKLQTGILVDLEIFRDVRGLHGVASRRIRSSLSAEVMPRNTGR